MYMIIPVIKKVNEFPPWAFDIEVSEADMYDKDISELIIEDDDEDDEFLNTEG